MAWRRSYDLLPDLALRVNASNIAVPWPGPYLFVFTFTCLLVTLSIVSTYSVLSTYDHGLMHAFYLVYTLPKAYIAVDCWFGTTTTSDKKDALLFMWSIYTYCARFLDMFQQNVRKEPLTSDLIAAGHTVLVGSWVQRQRYVPHCAHWTSAVY